MNALFRLLVCTVATLGFVGAASAQSPSPDDRSMPKTRTQVKAELSEWVSAEYERRDWLYYPESAQATDQIVAQRRLARAPAK